MSDTIVPLSVVVRRNRMSVLPMAQFCGMAGELSQIGAGRSAAMSSAFHAKCSGAENAEDLFVRLTDEEAQEIMTWKRPADVDLGSGRILRYDDAEKELAVAIDKDGCYVDPESPHAISVGHFDFAWIVEAYGVKIAYVADIKRSEFTVDEGVQSLQLHAYGLAYAGKHGCDGYVVGLWAAEEGLWQWSGIVDLSTLEAVNIMKRVVAAALNTSREYATGPHCRKCYGRLRCPAWLIAPQQAAEALKPYAIGGDITMEQAADALELFQRFEDTAKVVKNHLKAYAAKNGGIKRKTDGFVWRPVRCEGRDSISVAKVKGVLGDRIDEVMTKGLPYEQYRWTKP